MMNAFCCLEARLRRDKMRANEVRNLEDRKGVKAEVNALGDKLERAGEPPGVQALSPQTGSGEVEEVKPFMFKRLKARYVFTKSMNIKYTQIN